MHNFNMKCLVLILILQMSREGWRGADTEAKNVKGTRAAMLIFKYMLALFSLWTNPADGELNTQSCLS